MTGRKKIFILLPGLGCVERGAENATLELAKRLCQSFDLVIFCRGYPKELKGQKNIVIVKIPALSRDNKLTNFVYRSLPARLRTVLAIFQLDPAGLEMLSCTFLAAPSLLFGKFDLVWPINGLWGAIFCRFVRKVRGVPFIYASHGGEEPLIAVQKPDIYIALTIFTKKWIEKNFPKQKTVFIANGVDTKKFKIFNLKFKIGLERPIFVCAAALILQKRIDLAIRAVSKLKAGSLLILGAGPLKNELADMGEKLLGKERFMIKSVKHDDMPKYLRLADVFTLPSFADPAPLVYLEAAAMNLPLVAPNDERRTLDLGKMAIYCDVGDADDYAQALRKALVRKVRTRDYALLHSWDKIAKEYRKVINSVVQTTVQK